MSSTSALWFYSDANQQTVGPFSFDDLQKLRSAGVIEDHTLVIETGQANWYALSSAIQTRDLRADNPTLGLDLQPEPTPKTPSPSLVSIRDVVAEHRDALSRVPNTQIDSALNPKLLASARRALCGKDCLVAEEAPLVLHWSLGRSNGFGFLLTEERLLGKSSIGKPWSLPLDQIHTAEHRRVFGIALEVVINGSLEAQTAVLRTKHNQVLADLLAAVGNAACGRDPSCIRDGTWSKNSGSTDIGAIRAKESVAMAVLVFALLAAQWYGWTLFAAMAGVVIASFALKRIVMSESRVGLKKALISGLFCAVAICISFAQLSPEKQGYAAGKRQGAKEGNTLATAEQALNAALEYESAKYGDSTKQERYIVGFKDGFMDAFERAKHEKGESEAWKAGHKIGFMDAGMGYTTGAMKPGPERIEARARGAAGATFGNKEQRDAFVRGYEAGYSSGWKSH